MENKDTKDPRPENDPVYGPAPDLDALVNGAVRLGSGLGASVLGSLSDLLDQVGESLDTIRSSRKELPFEQWKQRLDRRLQSKKQGEALALAITGWVLAGCFGIAALVLWALAAVGAQALGVTQSEFMVLCILMACFTTFTVGFGLMGGFGVRKYRYIGRLRRYLRAARDWTCDIPALARASAMGAAQVEKDLRQAVAGGDLPDALWGEDGRLYLDASRAAPPQTPPEAAEPDGEPEREEDTFQREGQAFLLYLRSVQGKLDADTDEELIRMEKNCAAVLAFVRNHPEQQPRVRRFRDYYLPTTRKLLDTALGLGDAEVRHAREIRRDITGILHTLNQAYSKLYDTLLQEVSLDISTEIDTLETMLRQDGLTHDFETDFQRN